MARIRASSLACLVSQRTLGPNQGFTFSYGVHGSWDPTKLLTKPRIAGIATDCAALHSLPEEPTGLQGNDGSFDKGLRASQECEGLGSVFLHSPRFTQATSSQTLQQLRELPGSSRVRLISSELRTGCFGYSCGGGFWAGEYPEVQDCIVRRSACVNDT